MIGVTATGAMSSGTRLLARILKASPDIEGRHDASHGRLPVHTENVVVITRDPQITDASRSARWGAPPADGFTLLPLRPESETLIADRYPDALRIRYEDLVSDPEATIALMAAHFGIPAWPCPEPIYDGNAKWESLVAA